MILCISYIRLLLIMSTEIITFNLQKLKEIVNKKTFGKRGVTQESIAREMNLTVASMFYHNPAASKLATIATGLKVDINSLFDIPDSFLENKDTNVVSDELPEYKMSKEEFYKELYEQEKLINQLTKEKK